MPSPASSQEPVEQTTSASSSTKDNRRRARTSASRLPISLSCPHLPLLAIPLSTASPAAVSTTAVYGATTPTIEIFTRSHSESTATTTTEVFSTSVVISRRRTSMSGVGFPWGQERSGSGNRSPAAEFAGNIVRNSRPRPTTPPTIATMQNRMESMSTTVGKKRDSPKSNLRLELPPVSIADLERQAALSNRPMPTRNKLIGQTLMGLTLPATPDVGLSNIMFSGGRDASFLLRAGGKNDGPGGSGGALGGSHAGAQRALVSAGAGRGLLALLTPPDDNGSMDWRPQRAIGEGHTGGNRLTEISEPEVSMPTEPPIPESSISDESVSAPEQPTDGEPSIVIVNGSTPSPAEKPAETKRLKKHDWIMDAMGTFVGPNSPSGYTCEAVRLLAYTLPCPLPGAPGTGASKSNPVNPDRLPISALEAPTVAAAAKHQFSPSLVAKISSESVRQSQPQLDMNTGVTSALPGVTSIIQAKCGSARQLFIHISHVIDPQIPLSRLPSTPPIHSGSAFNSPFNEGSDGGYFSPSIFNSIVFAPGTMSSQAASGTPSRPYPPQLITPTLILPPDSLHLTLVERYIPPPSMNEDEAMFHPTKSLLHDRILELSPDGGSLLLIYPTKTGAKQFINEYLNPIMEPLLRRLMVLYALRDDLLWQISKMQAIDGMQDFSGLKRRLQHICHSLTTGHGDPNAPPAPAGELTYRPPIPTDLVFAEKVEVQLNDYSWREWWTAQEGARIRDVVKKHVENHPVSRARAKEMEMDLKDFWQGYGVPGDLAREVLDGVKAVTGRPTGGYMKDAVMSSGMNAGGDGRFGSGRATGEESYPEIGRGGVEVGVFVLQRRKME